MRNSVQNVLGMMNIIRFCSNEIQSLHTLSQQFIQLDKYKHTSHILKILQTLSCALELA